MAPATLDCDLKTFLCGVKGHAVEGRVEKAVAILTDPKVEVFSPGDLVGCKLASIARNCATAMTSGSHIQILLSSMQVVGIVLHHRARILPRKGDPGCN